MSMTRRDTLTALGAIAAAGSTTLLAAPKPSPLVPIAPLGGTRLYPTWIWPQWWTSQPILNNSWTLPNDPTQPPPLYVTGGYPAIGAVTAPDQSTVVQDVRNTPLHGVFTRAYAQVVTRPLEGAQTLSGRVSLAIHCVQWHRRINAVLALQVTVHRPDGSVRAVALQTTSDANPFPLGDPPRTRAAVGWPLATVAAQDGDVVAINVGLWADNQTRTLAQGVGFWFFGNQPTDITHIDSSAFGNTWVEFSSVLTFRP